ncbi:hypothetical protein IQ249_15200 [Lusitaniella coriacea LEGE 07157]|uniref:WGR domain-containing protein n=1 Tax=Lusitaniella coriacea LEGE 07157 TaxID=945747 RepID=A0A8J7DXP2_9CYAN|nr:hypothetical protein [Lusitaniella coriacea]MBE9117246.1 hypothetical protein [Lusitaniella coriacea LEGE 07157]
MGRIAYQFKLWKSAEWRRGERVYWCEVKQDLFGSWVVLRHWRGVKSGKWGMKETVCESYADAETLFEVVAKRREKRNYVRVEG